jgi:hypothetical protein
MALSEFRWLKGKEEEEDARKGNPILEAVFKPRWNVPLLSEYTSAVGRIAKKADVGVEKRSEKLKRKGILEEYNVQSMRHGVKKTKKVAEGEGGIVGYPKAMDMASFMPLIGDPETGKYSLFDVALAGAEAVPIYKGYEKGFESVFKHLTKPTKKKFEKKIQKALKKGGKEKLEAAAKWQKEWINDPETFLRQSGLRANDPETFMFGRFAGGRDEKFLRLARKPNMSRSKMKKEGFVDEWDAYIKYKDEMTKEFDRLEYHDKLPWKFENWLSDKKKGEWVRFPDETMEQWRNRVKFEREQWALGPGEVHTSKAAEKVKYGFGLPENKGYAGVYRHGYDVTDINDAMSRRVPPERMGSYHEMVEVNPAIKIKHYESTAVHELQHFITKGNENIPGVVSETIRALRHGDMDELVRVWKQKKLSVFKDGDISKGWRKSKGATDKEIKGTVEYFGDRTEIQARLQELRYSLGVKPGQKVTKDMMALATKSKKGNFYRDLVNVLGKDNVIKALNTLPSIVPMTTEENLFNQCDKEDNLF